MSNPTRPSLRHVPALDGLRGLAVAGVVAYHAGFGWATGGYLGVSAFFTLSGYLITALLLVEWEGTGGISLRGFWSRRFRRLLPAALALLAAVVVAASFLADGSQLADLRRDVVAALGYVANWHFVLEDRSYGETFAGPSPLQHLWSLAIEEQFYVVFPLVTLALLRLGRGRRSLLAGVFGLATLASLWWTLRLAGDPSGVVRSYFDTGARAAEILVGVLLALALTGRLAVLEDHRRPIAGLGAAALAVMAFTWVTVPQSSSFVHSGGLVLHAVLMAVVLTAAHVAGPVQALCSTRGLRLAGRVSYGLYLVHWPVFVWVDEARTGLDGLPLFALRMAIAGALTAASYRWIEQPIRSGRALRGRRAPVVGLAGATAVVVVAISVGTLRPATDDLTTVLDALPAAASTPDDAPRLLTASAPSETAADAAGTVDDVLLVGDSLLSQVSEPLIDRLGRHGIRAEYAGGPGTGPLSPKGSWAGQVDAWVDAMAPDVVVIAACCNYTMDSPDHYVTDDGTPVPPGSDGVLPAWEHEMRDLLRRATSSGARVLLVQGAPVSTNGWYGELEEHVEALNALYARLATTVPGVTLIDWGETLTVDGSFTWDLPGDDGEPVRVRLEDGVHLTDTGRDMVADATFEVIADRSDA